MNYIVERSILPNSLMSIPNLYSRIFSCSVVSPGICRPLQCLFVCNGLPLIENDVIVVMGYKCLKTH